VSCDVVGDREEYEGMKGGLEACVGGLLGREKRVLRRLDRHIEIGVGMRSTEVAPGRDSLLMLWGAILFLFGV
jgi:hypothetical protein